VTTELRTAEAAEQAVWPNLTRAAAMFGVSVATMSRWAEEADRGTWLRGEKCLRPRDLLALAERQARPLYDVASAMFAHTREVTADHEVRRRVREEINAYLAEYQRRRDPARVLTQAEFLEELRGVLPAAEFEKVRARLQTQPRPEAADMFSAEEGSASA